MKTFFLAAALLAATPAYAETPRHGPVIVSGSTTATTVSAPLDPAELERRRLVKQANRWEAAYLTMSAVDLVQTCDALNRGVAHEVNPLLGKRPSCGKLFAFKALAGGLHYLLFDHLRDRSPKHARLGAQLSFGTQSLAVGLNLRYAFKGR